MSLHRFRHAAGTLWSIEDPENIRGTKDLLAHVSYDKTTEAHYVMGQSRIAGRALAGAIDAATGYPSRRLAPVNCHFVTQLVSTARDEIERDGYRAV